MLSDNLQLDNTTVDDRAQCKVAQVHDNSMSRVEETSLFGPRTSDSIQGNMSAAKLMGKRTHQMPGRLNVSELFFEVPKDHSRPQNGSLRLFARSVERFEKPVDASKKEVKQPPWCTHYSIFSN